MSSTGFNHNSFPKDQPSRSDSGDNGAFRHTQEEHFVDAGTAAEFLSISRKHVLRLSRLGKIPAHPISFGRRITWRYLLSELRAWVLSNSFPIKVAPNAAYGRTIVSGSPRKGGR